MQTIRLKDEDKKGNHSIHKVLGKTVNAKNDKPYAMDSGVGTIQDINSTVYAEST